MAVDLEDEILQDFLLEAGEILELLGEEQLVELEQSPEDNELLNAIFRGFHTIKGGAGFLALDPLVAICHKAEDVFDVLREGECIASPELMDVILEVVDVVNLMFEQIRAGSDPDKADDALLARLHDFTRAGRTVQKIEVTAVETEILAKEFTVEASNTRLVGSDIIEHEFEEILGNISDSLENDRQLQPSDEITEEEFDGLLDELHGKGKFTTKNTQKQVPTEADSGDITEEEFDSLLDELHGKGKFTAKNTQKQVPTEADSGDITEEEFDSLLDELHGKGKFTAKNTQKQVSTEVDSGDITEEEFDSLLDELHGKGKFTAKNTQKQVSTDVGSSDITEEEFDNVLDELHGKGKFNGAITSVKTEKEEQPEKEVQVVNTVSVVKEKPGIPKKTVGAKKTGTVKQGETTVRVDTQVLDDIMNMVGELVLVRNRFQNIKASADDCSAEQLAQAVSNLDIVTADLQLAVMKTRMQPIKKVFGRFPRVVRDLSRSLNKEIKLELVGEETDLDKNLVEALADPLVHLVRNAVDHGIELPEDRVTAGKQREGLVVLTASQEGDHIMLSIKDDGKGMNPDVLRRSVVEKGLMDEEAAHRLDDKECFNLIFMPGFSTKKEISDVSGRGVGMDVVKTRISQINGVVEIDSVENAGSTITIKVPLTLAIMPTLMIKLSEQAFALPLANVLEILDLNLNATNVVDGQLVIMVRNKALPLFYLSDWLVNSQRYDSEDRVVGHVVVVNSGGKQIGFVVDQLVGQEEVVIKPLGAKLQGLAGLAGATITGDGQIALILDVPGLMGHYVG